MTTIAVIQPYFFPYAGYYRLFAAADTVVMFDCVQFPRRGWVHRNRFALASGELDWLTLPIEKAPRDVRISDLRFREDASARLCEDARRFPALERARAKGDELVECMLRVRGAVTDYLIETISKTAEILGLRRDVIRSSSLSIPAELRSQDRVIEIVRRLGGTRYVNPSGGRDLYDPQAFAAAGFDLRFLTPFDGSMESILSRLTLEAPGTLRAQIEAQSIQVP